MQSPQQLRFSTHKENVQYKRVFNDVHLKVNVPPYYNIVSPKALMLIYTNIGITTIFNLLKHMQFFT